MSRCKACNKKLSEFELTRKSVNLGDYLDLCNHCFSTIAEDCDVLVRPDLFHDTEEDDGEPCEESTMPQMSSDGEGQTW